MIAIGRLAALLLLVGAPASLAHHSFAAEFTVEKTATITGTVSEVWFRNPHVRYYVDVQGEDDALVRWDTRAGSPSLLTRRGWTKDRIRAGDVVTMMGHLAHDESRHLLSIVWIELPDGTRLE